MTRVELVNDGTFRIALFGLLASGKTTLAKAFVPSLEVAGVGSFNSLSEADAIVYVHDLQLPGLNQEEVDDLKAVSDAIPLTVNRNLIAVGSHRDCVQDSCIEERAKNFSAKVKSILGLDVPVLEMSAPLWLLARDESSAGREVAARCFRQASGLEPAIKWIEGVRWSRAHAFNDDIVRMIAEKVSAAMGIKNAT